MKMGQTISMGVGLVFVLGVASGAMAQSPSPEASPLVEEATGEAVSSEEGGMRLTSTAFEHEGDIPADYTCDGADVSPALTLHDLPAEAVSLVLVLDDPDAPGGTWDHWVEYDIPVMDEIPEGVEALGTPGSNSWERTGYGGPCPPSGTHRYFFVVYALGAELGLEPGADKAAVLEAMADQVLAEATLIGHYSRS